MPMERAPLPGCAPQVGRVGQVGSFTQIHRLTQHGCIRSPLHRRRVQGVSEETGYTERGRRWGTGDPTCDLCIPIKWLLGGGLLDEVALDAHLGRALEVLLTELHLSDLLVGVEEGIDLLAHLLECCLGLLLLLL